MNDPVTDITPTSAIIEVFPPASGGPWQSYEITVCPNVPAPGARRLLQQDCFVVTCPSSGGVVNQAGPTSCPIPTQPGVPYQITVSSCWALCS